MNSNSFTSDHRSKSTNYNYKPSSNELKKSRTAFCNDHASIYETKADSKNVLPEDHLKRILKSIQITSDMPSNRTNLNFCITPLKNKINPITNQLEKIIFHNRFFETQLSQEQNDAGVFTLQDKSFEINNSDTLNNKNSSFDMMKPRIEDKQNSFTDNSLSCTTALKYQNSPIKNWSVLLSIAKAVKKLNYIEVKSIDKTEEIDDEINAFRKKKEVSIQRNDGGAESFFNFERKADTDEEKEQIILIRELHLIFEDIREGKFANLNRVICFYMKDIKRNIFSNKDDYLINKPNSDGFTPLYVACINGHLNYVKALINADSNHLIKVKDESVLDAALRWNQLSVFEYLMTLSWPKEYIVTCKKLSENLQVNSRIKQIIACEYKKRRKSTSCCFS